MAEVKGKVVSIKDREGTPKNFCDKDFAEISGELSGAICLKTLVLLVGSTQKAPSERAPSEFT